MKFLIIGLLSVSETACLSVIHRHYFTGESKHGAFVKRLHTWSSRVFRKEMMKIAIRRTIIGTTDALYLSCDSG